MFSLLYGILCIAIAHIAGKLGLDKKYTRKIVHILVGFEWVILYHYFGASYHFLIVCLVFTILLALTYKHKLIRAISSDSDNAPGTVYYGISMSVMAFVCLFLPEYMLPFGIAVACTSLSDGFAGVIGALIKRYNPRIFKNKTLFGSISCFLLSVLSVLVFKIAFSLKIGFFNVVAISLFVAGIELISSRGLDNISVPLSTFALTHFILYSNSSGYILPIIFTPFIIALVLEKNILSYSGVAAAVILDVVVSLAFGNFGFLILLAFLMLTAVIDKIRKHIKKSDSQITEKGDKRDEVQVLANGFIPLVAALMYMLTLSSVYIVVYTAALAECFADSCASGVGTFSKNAFDPFRFKRVQAGLSGGMSILGTIASLIGAASLPLIAVAFGLLDAYHYLVVVMCAFAGAIFDSALGSLLQVKYKCDACGALTEKKTHCNQKTVRASGIGFISNDVVNVASCAFSALLVYLILII